MTFAAAMQRWFQYAGRDLDLRCHLRGDSLVGQPNYLNTYAHDDNPAEDIGTPTVGMWIMSTGTSNSYHILTQSYQLPSRCSKQSVMHLH